MPLGGSDALDNDAIALFVDMGDLRFDTLVLARNNPNVVTDS